MQYLISQIFFCLVAATLVGAAITYFIMKSKRIKLQAESDEWRNKHNALEAYRDRINRDFFVLKNKNKAHVAEIATLKHDLTEAKIQGQTHSLERNDMQEKYKKFMQEYKHKTRLLEEEREQFQAKQEQANQKVKDLMERISALVSDNEQALSVKESIAHEREHLNTQLIDMSSEQSRMKKNLRLLHSESEKLTTEVEILAREKADYEERVNELIAEQSSLLEKVESIKAEKKQAIEAVSELTVEMDDMTTQILNLKNERDDYFGKLKTISSLAESIK